MALLTALEAGYAYADLRQHAARPAIGGGRTAVCGAGPIVNAVAGRFGTTMTEACPDCLQVLLPKVRSAALA